MSSFLLAFSNHNNFLEVLKFYFLLTYVTLLTCLFHNLFLEIFSKNYFEMIIDLQLLYFEKLSKYCIKSACIFKHSSIKQLFFDKTKISFLKLFFKLVFFKCYLQSQWFKKKHIIKCCRMEINCVAALLYLLYVFPVKQMFQHSL